MGHPSKTPSGSSLHLHVHVRLDRLKRETLMRILVAEVAAFGLTLASIPQVVPPSQSFIIGVVGAVAGFSFPYLLFAPGLVFPSLLCNLLFALIVQSALLAAAVVSDGCLVAVYAVYVLWCTSLYFGADFNKTGGAMGLLTSTPGLLALSYRPLVQASDDQADGLAIVAKLWTEQGLSNPLAGNRNLMICIAWGMACVVLATLLPPWQTARAVLTQTLVPAALTQAHRHMTTTTPSSKSGEQDDDRAKLAHYLSMLQPSTAGLTLFEPRLVTAPGEFSVPLLQDLLQATDRILLAAFLTPTTITSKKQDDHDDDDSKQKPAAMAHVELAATIRTQCASALMTASAPTWESLQQDLNSLQEQCHLLLHGDGGGDEETQKDYQEERYHLICSQRLLQATRAWISNQLQPPRLERKVAVQNMTKTALVWIMVPLGPLKRLFTAPLTVLSHPQQWNGAVILWSLKYTAGLMGLFLMSTYWDWYSQFAIKADELDEIGAVFNGWNLLSYTIAWTATVEGTFKMASMRLLGTALGGFAGWLALVVCSGFASHIDADTDINKYGLAAWLTTLTIVVAYFSIGDGLAAHFGPSSSAAKVEIWFVLTMVLVSLEVEAGKGPANDIVANRVVATATGVALAALVAWLPPNVRGSTSEHTELYLDALKAAYAETLKGLLSMSVGDESMDNKKLKLDDSRTALEKASKKRTMAGYLLKDASKLKQFPIFKVNPGLQPLLEDMFATESLLYQFLDLSAYLLDANVDGFLAEVAPGSPSHVALRRLADGLLVTVEEAVTVSKTNGDKKDSPDYGDHSPSPRVQLLLDLASLVSDRIRDHCTVLASISKG